MKNKTVNYTCGCGKTEVVSGVMLTPADAAAAVIELGWVTLGSSVFSCSPECHNRCQEDFYNSWREGGGYERWWEYSPYGRAKYDCDPPSCDCPRFWETVEHPTRGTIRLLDYRHYDHCWWHHKAVSAPHPEGKTILPKVCFECGEPAELYVVDEPAAKGSDTRFTFLCRTCRGWFTLTSNPRTAPFEQ